MEKHQERVVAERTELAKKISNLAKFTKTDTFSALSANEQNRLRRQLMSMGSYLNVLSERIAAFS